MTVAQFIEWLKTQDQEAIVQCLVVGPRDSNNRVYDNLKAILRREAHIEEFEPEWSEYIDFRGNKFVKPGAPYYGKRYLWIG